jgi:hypothetical protein
MGFTIMHPSLGYEVAEDPAHRQPTFGAAPPLAAIVEVTEAIVRAAPRSSSPRRP